MSATSGRPALVGLPVNLLLAGRKIVVVGGGRIAARKIADLVNVGALVRVIALEIIDAIALLEREGKVTVALKSFETQDLDGAWLVLTATGDLDVDAAVHAEAEARNLFCNSADDPAHCSFTLMSVVRQGDLVVALGTGGRSPAIAKWLKEILQQEIGPEYSTLLDIFAEARESLRSLGRSSEDANWRLALDSGIVDLVKSGRVDEAKELLNSCL